MAHLSSFGVGNFKVFKDTYDFELRPITILTGTNSSGKSSLTKAIRLMASTFVGKYFNSIEILKFDKENEIIGNFEVVKNYNNVNDIISFSVPFKWYGLPYDMTLILDYKLDQESRYKDGYLHESRIVLNDTGNILYKKSETYDKDGNRKKANYPPYETYESLFNSALFKKIFLEFISSFGKITHLLDFQEFLKNNSYKDTFSKGNKIYYRTILLSKMFEQLFGYAKSSWTNETIKEQTQSLKDFFISIKNMETWFDYDDITTENKKYYSKDIELLKTIEEDFFSKYSHEHITHLGKAHLFSDTISFEDILFDFISNGLNDANAEIKISKDKFKLGNKYKLMESMANSYDESFKLYKRIFSKKNIHFIPSIRSFPKRYISRQGNNSYFENLITNISINPKHSGYKKLNKWLQEFGIADEIVIDTLGDSGLVDLHLIKDGKKINIVDVGFGFAQLLPILITVFFFKYKIIVVEEPETNLHPALQSKLADFFAYCYKELDIQFIIETHSEYLIRKMQFLVAKGEFDPKDANMYYFYHPDHIPEGEQQIKKIQFKENGKMDHTFGSGFFDESENLAIELFLLNKAQNN